MAVLDRLKVKLEIEGDDKDALLAELLDEAKSAILLRLYPFNDTVTVIPARYETLQVEIAVYLFNKLGAEGQTEHSENGIDRTYESGGIPESLLSTITPMVGVPK